MNGQLVYSTNSMNPIENEAVVAAVLEEASGMGLFLLSYHAVACEKGQQSITGAPFLTCSGVLLIL